MIGREGVLCYEAKAADELCQYELHLGRDPALAVIRGLLLYRVSYLDSFIPVAFRTKKDCPMDSNDDKALTADPDKRRRRAEFFQCFDINSESPGPGSVTPTLQYRRAFLWQVKSDIDLFLYQP